MVEIQHTGMHPHFTATHRGRIWRDRQAPPRRTGPMRLPETRGTPEAVAVRAGPMRLPETRGTPEAVAARTGSVRLPQTRGTPEAVVARAARCGYRKRAPWLILTGRETHSPERGQRLR